MDFISNAYGTLVSNSFLAQNAENFPAGSKPVLRKHNGREYWYVVLPDNLTRYLGPNTAFVRQQVDAIKQGLKETLQNSFVVQGLLENGYPGPGQMAGEILQDMASCGVFRLRAVLVGTLAFQCYQPMLGLEPNTYTKTGDIDICQFSSISMAVQDSVVGTIGGILKRHGDFAQILDSRNKPDPKWKDVKSDLAVDILTPWRPHHKEDREEKTKLKALGALAQKMDFLEYLIYREMPAVLLYGNGIPVNVPRPEKYCIHKILVAYERSEDGVKFRKDIGQAIILMRHFLKNDPKLLEKAVCHALALGRNWRRRLDEAFAEWPELKPYAGWYSKIAGCEEIKTEDQEEYHTEGPK